MSALQSYLVVGSGSIARRHIANIKALFSQATVGCVSASGRELSLEEVGADIVYASIEEALSAEPMLAIIASPAPLHVDQAATFLRTGIPVLIEKPLSDSLESFARAGEVLLANSTKIEVAYNLRFMPSAIRLKALLDEQILGRIHSVSIEVGQYLPDWRPATDYRENVSARKELGGGVLLELSHELDYLTWLFGTFNSIYCVASNSGTLDVDVEDSAHAILSREDGLVASVHLDFLQRVPTRICKIIGESGTLVWNLLQNSILLGTANNSEDIIFSDPNYNRNDMYLEEISHFVKVAVGERMPQVSIYQALDTLRLIEALRHSSVTRKVVDIGDFAS
ncbi:Gfo/Idh/MocA family oxidoreductase [Stutzerimonas stutzeri]|uniref:Gfo/Idh/MocA family protein n=1 Tax=Stutzerimonas stutzeri TaxID=316 RepID=UPI00300EB3D7